MKIEKYLPNRSFKAFVAMLGLMLGLVACGPADSGSDEAGGNVTEIQTDADPGSNEAGEAGAADEAEGADSDAQAEPKPVNIYLTRHTQTMLNALHRVQGWSDAPLTDKGVDQAAALGEGFAAEGIDFDRAYTADTSRQYETAAVALEAAGIDLEIVRDERIREIAFGAFEGDLNSNMMGLVAEKYGYDGEYDLYAHMGEVGFINATDAVADVAPDSDLTIETSDEVVERLLGAMEEIALDAQANGEEDVLIVSSMIAIMCVLGELGVDLNEIPELQNGAVNKIVYDNGEWTVESYNDGSYMETFEEAA